MPQNLLAIHGVKGLICAVGEGGKILHWTGDGMEPVAVQSPTKADLSGVWVESERSAWAVGERGTVLRWDGEHWHTVALAHKADELHAVFGFPGEGVWIGGQGRLIQYQGMNGHGSGTTHRTESTVLRIWGSGPDDVWFLCAGKEVLHWHGTGCATMDLPGDEDDEFYGLCGYGPNDAVWICGVGGALYSSDGEGWTAFDSGTEDTISGVACAGPDDVWVTTNGGQLRHWTGEGWDAAAFSPHGYLAGLCIVEGEVWAVGERGLVLRHRPSLQ